MVICHIGIQYGAVDGQINPSFKLKKSKLSKDIVVVKLYEFGLIFFVGGLRHPLNPPLVRPSLGGRGASPLSPQTLTPV